MSDTPHTPTTELPGDFRLGDLRVRPDRLLIEHDEGTVRLEPRVMEMLVMLATHGGQTVSRDALREHLWDAYVTDDAIHRAVFKLRRALGAHAELIETVPKRGYRVTRAAQPLDDDNPGAPAPADAATDSVRRAFPQWGVAALLLLATLVALAIWSRPPTSGTEDRGEAADVADVTPTFVPFTALSGYETHPAFDAARGTVVFANFAKEGPDAFQWDLWSKPIDGGETTRLTATPQHEVNPALSPSGRMLGYLRLGEGTCEVVVEDLDDGSRTPLAGGCGVTRGSMDCCSELAWLDDERLLVSRRDDAAGAARIYEVEWRSGARRLVTDPPAQWFGDTAMAVSHDGARLAVVRRRAPELAELYVMDLAEGGLRQLTAAGYPISAVAWGADDHELIFASDRTGTSALWRVPANGGRAEQLPTVGMNASSPALVSGALLYEEWKSEINVWRLEIDVGEALPWLSSTRWDWRAQPSPDGRRIAFVSNRAGSAELWLADADGGNERQLSTLGRGVASVPSWLPDGTRIVVAAAMADSLDILSISAADGSVKTLVSDASDERDPVLSADGAYLFFASNRGGAWDIWRLRLRGGLLERWTVDGGAVARPAADGGSVWHVRADVAGLWRQSHPGASAELVDARFRPAAPSDWVVRSDGIYYLRLDAQQNAFLARFDPATGEHIDLAMIEGEGGIGELYAGGGLWVSPDARHALIASIDLSQSDLWIGR